MNLLPYLGRRPLTLYRPRLRPAVISLVVLLLQPAAAAVLAQPPPQPVTPTPDSRGEITLGPPPVYLGIQADAPIPAAMHFRNEGGSDGSGLCVVASVVIDGHYAGVPDLMLGKQSQLWKTAKSRPGGYYPEKLARLLGEVLPAEKWVSYSDRDSAKLGAIMDDLSARAGRWGQP